MSELSKFATTITAASEQKPITYKDFEEAAKELEEAIFSRATLEPLLLNDIRPTEKEPTPMNPHFNAWEVAESVLKVSRRVLLRGKPGTGKTFTAVNTGLREDQKVYQLTMTPETPMAEIRGHYITKGGDFVWHDGPAMRAWREGARLVINEIDRAGEDVLSFLYAVLDDPDFAETTLPTGEVVKPKEGFQVVATMNGEPDDLPDALQDRLPVDIEIKELHPDALARLPEDLRDPAKNSSLSDNPERSISIRMWMEFSMLREKVGEEYAAEAVFGPKAGAALTALRVGAEASPAHDMEGKELTPQQLDIKEYLQFAKTQLDVSPERKESAGKYVNDTFKGKFPLDQDWDFPVARAMAEDKLWIKDPSGRKWRLEDFQL